MQTTALGYYGGKSALSKTGTGRWVASLLPPTLSVSYCEPFAGMLGVLLQRAEAKQEIVNDINDRLINWWRVVRDKPEEFDYLVRHTPHSHAEFDRAKDRLDEGEDIERALAFHTVIQQGLLKGDNDIRWAVRRGPTAQRTVWDEGRIGILAERLRNVQIECRDAVDLLGDMAEVKESIIYVDPPYLGTRTSPYRAGLDAVDHDALAEVLLRQRGEVAISGYGETWDRLGWYRHEHSSFAQPHGANGAAPRVEVLWTNYPAPQQRLL